MVHTDSKMERAYRCVPQRALMRDPAIYPNAMTFDGFRFIDSEQGNTAGPRSRKFTDLDPFILYGVLESKLGKS